MRVCEREKGKTRDKRERKERGRTKLEREGERAREIGHEVVF